MSKTIHSCHKCGLLRAGQVVGLPDCMCLGQTWFSYEGEIRTEKEAIEIANEVYRQRLQYAADSERIDSLKKMYGVAAY